MIYTMKRTIELTKEIEANEFKIKNLLERNKKLREKIKNLHIKIII